MLNLFNTRIESLSLHRVGNRSRQESIFLSETPCPLDDETGGLLKEYFLRPFREREENFYHFIHETDVAFNEVYQLATEIFASPENMHQVSKKLATHLYNQSVHPHIKSGELYVAFLKDAILDNTRTEVLGIFKSEIKQDFIRFREANDNLEIEVHQGINVNKLDKGCLIFNMEKEAGFRVLSVDSNRYDAKYWLEQFLNLTPRTDENFYTRNYLKFCRNFARDVVLPAEDKQQEVLFMNRAVHHFASNDAFEESEFLNEVIENPDLIPEFRHYKVEKGPKYSIEDVSNFNIANQAVSDSRKKLSNVIHLDTNIHIKLDFISQGSAEKFVEKGWDEERQMYYYLCYFNKEQKR